jgi:hypothetical protein
MELTERQIDVLRDLAYLKTHADECTGAGPGDETNWAKPMDFGGCDRSHHGETAVCLAKKGLVDSYKYATNQTNNFNCRKRGARSYRITAKGMRWLRDRGML